MTIYLSLLVCLLGLVLYYVFGNPPSPSTPNSKTMEVGRLMFAVGLLVFLLQFGGGHAVSMFNR